MSITTIIANTSHNIFRTYFAKFGGENPVCHLNSKPVAFLYRGASYPLYDVTLICYKSSCFPRTQRNAEKEKWKLE
jgi:hypothetical protein